MTLERGLLAELPDERALVRAVARLREEGLTHLDTYSPFSVEGVWPYLEERTRVPLAVLICGLSGATLAYFLQWWIHVYAYPLNVGGRPLHSAPSFIPLTLITGILAGGLAAFVGLLWYLRPRLRAAVDTAPPRERFTRDGLFVVVGGDDPRFDEARARHLLDELGAVRVVAFGGGGTT